MRLNLPSPELYSDWKQWAGALLTQLQSEAPFTVEMATELYQPVDAGLTWLSGLTFSSEATFKAAVNLEAGTDFNAYDAGLEYLSGLNFTTEGTFKAAVNLEISVDVQAYDARLTTIAGGVFDSTIITQGASAGVQINPRDGSGSNFQWYNPTGDALHLYNGSTDILTIATSGNITASGSCNVLAGILSSVDPSSAWAYDTNTSGYSLVNNGTKDFSTGSGLIILNDGTNGQVGVFSVGATVVTKISGPAHYVSGAPAAGQVGISWTGSAYRLTNAYGSTATFYIATIRARPVN